MGTTHEAMTINITPAATSTVSSSTVMSSLASTLSTTDTPTAPTSPSEYNYMHADNIIIIVNL